MEDTRGSSSRDVSSQLVRQAQERRSEKTSRGSEGREKREKDSERKEILALLNQVASRGASGGNGGDSPSRKGERGRSSKKKKKKKKRSKSRKRKRKLVNGVIMSSDGSGSSSDRDSSSEGSSSEGGFEAPLRRRSKANPGAVLRILVQRARGIGPGLPCRGLEGHREVNHRGGEDKHLLQPPCEAGFLPTSSGYARLVLDEPDTRHHPSGVDSPCGGPRRWALPCGPSSPDGSGLEPGEISRGGRSGGTVSNISCNTTRGTKACQSKLQGRDTRRVVPPKRMAKRLESRRKRRLASGKGQEQGEKGRKAKRPRLLAGQRGKRQEQVEGVAGQRRQRGEIEEVLVGQEATVRPSRDDGGVAPLFQVELSSAQKVNEGYETVQVSGNLIGGSIERTDIEFGTGQSICLAVGSRVRDFKSAGTLLAWLVAQAMVQKSAGPWRWVEKVLFDSQKVATGHEKLKRAVSFPMRRGETERVFQRLLRAGLEEVASVDFSEEWAEDAWLFLALHATNGLAGPCRPLACGKWSALEARGAAAARRGVQRLLACSSGALVEFEKVGADLKVAKMIIPVRRLVLVRN